MLGKCAKVVLLWTAFFSVLWLCYGMVGKPTHVMAYIFCSALSVLAFVPAMYETILLVGYMMLNNIPTDSEMDEWDIAELDVPAFDYESNMDDGPKWDVTIGARDGMFFHLYQDEDIAFPDLFVGKLCENWLPHIGIIEIKYFSTKNECVDWFLAKAAELEASKPPVI